MASHRDDIFGEVKGHTNKLCRETVILMHYGSLSCCHRINLEDSRDYPTYRSRTDSSSMQQNSINVYVNTCRAIESFAKGSMLLQG